MEEEINLIDYLKMIIKKWKVILAIFLIALIVGAVFSFTTPKIFQAQAVIKVGKWVAIEQGALENVSETIQVLKGNFPGVEISNPAITSYLVTIKASAQTSEQALDAVNLAVDSMLARHQKDYQEAKLSLENEIAEVEKEINELQEKIRKEENTFNQARAQMVQGYFSRLTVVEGKLRPLKEISLLYRQTQLRVSPTLPQNPVKPNIKLNLLVVAVVGIFIGIFIALSWGWWEKEKNKMKLT